MSDTATVLSGWGTALSARAGGVALAVAAVLDDRCSAMAGAAATSAFLREWASTTIGDVSQTITPLDLLATRFDLTQHECELIVLAGLPDEHEGIASTLRSLHPDGEPRPTVGLAALLLGGSAADRSLLRHVLTSGSAVRHGLILLGKGPFFERSLTLPDCLWSSLHGLDAWPDELSRVQLEVPPPGLDRWVGGSDAIAAARVISNDRRAVVLITSDEDAVALARCSALAAVAARPVVGARFDPSDAARMALLAAQAAVRGAVPLLVVPPSSGCAAASLSLGDVPGAIIVCAASGTVRPPAERAVVAMNADPVDTIDRRVAWAAAVPSLALQADALAARHPLDPAITAQIGADVDELGTDLDLAGVSHLINVRAAASLPTGVRLVTPNVPWSHIVLPTESALQLRDAVARLDHQTVVLEEWDLRERAHATGGGRLLFTGPPGTGKSLAAGAVATAAQTGLLIVDVSRVVSKWLGETEKNLAAAFEAAERTQAVLLLDEADALFATRTEISDAHDRYANLETAYLLQRLDHFDGLAILTTNLRANIDTAFIRRMDFVVEFPLPDELGRHELWSRHLPPGALADDVDIEGLARLYPVPGGWIRNSAVAAAFGAAAAHDHITQLQLVAAMRREYAKAALPFPGEPARRRHDPY